MLLIMEILKYQLEVIQPLLETMMKHAYIQKILILLRETLYYFKFNNFDR